jgi:hypothetical protein
MRIGHPALPLLGVVPVPRWLSLLGLLPLCSSSASALTIDLHRDAITEGQRVLLVDVADVRGGPPKLACRLRALDLGPAPRPGLPRTFTREHLQQRVRAAGLASSRVSWAGAEATHVARRTVPVSGERLAAAAAALARKALPRAEKEHTIRIAETPPAAQLLPPRRDLRCRVLLPAADRLRGEVSVPVAICRKATILAMRTVVLEVERESSQLTARPDRVQKEGLP